MLALCLVESRRRLCGGDGMTLEQRLARRSGKHTPVYYPSSDGKPMAETDLHREEIARLIATLQAAFTQRSDVYVSGNLLLYYEEGNPRRSVAPDVFVVFGIAKHRRETYKLWEEGRGPAVVIEVTSRSTRREDMGRKRILYAALGVREYYLYDPRFPGMLYLDPPLQGNRLTSEQYRAITAEADGALFSDALGMRLLLIEGRLQFFQDGVRLYSPAERTELEVRRADLAERWAETEAQHRAAAELRAEEEFERAELEAAARREAERRIAELEALLRARGGGR